MSEALNKLSEKKRKYVKARVKGKTKKAAALEAGYSESVALKAKDKIETPDVQKAFQELIRTEIPGSKIAQRVKEGLDAMETKFFKMDDKIEERQVIAHSERRQYAALAAELGQYHLPKKAVEAKTSGNVTVILLGE